MHIDSVRVLHIARPLSRPETFGDRPLTRHESVLVELRSSSHSGWGEADPGTAPAESGQWAGAAYLCLKDWLVPQVVGQDLASGRALDERLRHVGGNSAAKAALDIAWWNLAAEEQGLPLASLLSAKKTALVPGVVLEGGETLEPLMAAISAALAQGYVSIGLKFRPGRGLEMVRAVRAEFPTIGLWIDCDGLCGLDQREMFFRLDDFLLQRIEQPLAADDLVGQAMLQEAIRTPIALDQSITSLQRVEQALDLGSCRQVRIDAQQVGGITPALAIAAAAAAKGVTVLAGVATSPRSRCLARALALAAPFADHFDVGGAALLPLAADSAGADEPGQLAGVQPAEHILAEHQI